MPSWNRFPPKSRPRKVKGGIAARARRGAIGESWWSARFVAALESLAIGSRLQRGKSYARGGQVVDLHVESGSVRARVQGSRREPYDVWIDVKPLRKRDWARIEKELAGQALFAARLLAGEMPREIEEVFAALDLSLFPATATELRTSCSCPDFANPCKHIAASFYILAESFDDDPFLIFRWRGRSREELVSRLRSLRGAAAGKATASDGAATAANEAGGSAGAAGGSAGGSAGGTGGSTGAVGESGGAAGGPAGAIAKSAGWAKRSAGAPPFVASIDAFWRVGAGFEGVRAAPHASDAAGAVLRQLGPPPREAGGGDLFDRLLDAYRAMAAGAERLALEERGGWASGVAAADRPISSDDETAAGDPAPDDGRDAPSDGARVGRGRDASSEVAQRAPRGRGGKSTGDPHESASGHASAEKRAPKPPRYFVTDMRDFEEDGQPSAGMQPPARRLYDFLSAIARTATSLPEGETACTALRCRRRAGRSACGGHLLVQADPDAAAIDWRCDECGEAGVLSGWECSIHDLGGRRRADCGGAEGWTAAALDESDYRQLEKLDVLDLAAEQLVRGATFDGDAIWLEGCREAFEALDAEIEIAIEMASRGTAAKLEALRRRIGM